MDGPASLPPNTPTALSIHIGATNTHIIPIIKDSIDWSHVKRINWGGVLAADFLMKILGLKYPGILNSSNPNRLTLPQAQAIWQKTALVAADIPSYESEMDSLSRASSPTLASLNCCIKLTGDAASEAQRRQAAAEAKQAAAMNQVALQEKRKILAEKLKQKSEEQRLAKLKSKEHIYKALQGLLERVQLILRKSATIKKKSSAAAAAKDEDEDISMEFSDDEEEQEGEQEMMFTKNDDVSFTVQNVSDSKLFEELKRLGFKSLNGLQEGLRRAEEDYFRLSGQQSNANPSAPIDFSLLNVADSELSEAEIREKRRLRLIKSSADARERQKAEKAAEDARKQAAAEALERRRKTDLEGWRVELYGKRKEIIDRLIRRQKQRADRKGAAQGSRFRSVVALGESNEESSSSNNNSTGGATPSGPSDSGPDDGFGLNDDDWLVYRQVSRDDEEDSDLIDQETLAQIETLLEEKDHVEFMRVLQEEQYASLTLLDRLTFGESVFDSGELEIDSAAININAERYRCTEGLFQPLSIQGIDQAGLVEILSNLFSMYPRDTLVELIKNVHVTGGPAGIPGLKERLTNEITSILPDDLAPLLNICVSNDLEGAWKGIQRRCIDPKAEFNWITRDEYFERRPSAEEIAVKQEEAAQSTKKKKTSNSMTSTSANPQIIINLNNRNCSNPY